jgi:hypothetical protein
MTRTSAISTKDFAQLFQLTTSIQRTTDSLRTDIRNELGGQRMILQAVQTDIRQLKHSVRKLGVLYEDLNTRFEAEGELH